MADITPATPVSYPNTFQTGATYTGSVSNLVLTAYDKLIHWRLRSQPLFDQWADVRPSSLTNPGATVQFQMVNGLTPVLGTLNERQDSDPVALGNTSTMTVTVQEWGNSGLITRKLELTSLVDVDTILATELANNMADTQDIQAQLALNGKFTTLKNTAGGVAVGAAGSGVALTSYSGATPVYTGSGDAASLTNTSSGISSNLVRYAVTKLRANNIAPTKGTFYTTILHPEVAVDLRQETGSAAWRDPHVYSAPDAIFAGELGAYEGAFFIENPRCFNGQVGAGTGGTQTRVYNSFVLGQQALAKAVAIDPHMTVGPVIDQHGRFRRMGWYGMVGWGAFRATNNGFAGFSNVDAAYQLVTTSSVRPNA